MSSWKPELPEGYMGISPERLAKISEDVARFRHGLWAEELKPEPACSCGLTDRSWSSAKATFRRFGEVNKECARHGDAK